MSGRNRWSIFTLGLGFLLGLTVSALAFGAWRASSIEWCGLSDTNCGREWTAALSGWVGAFLAVITIIYLSKQIRDADRQNRNSNLIVLWSKRSIAKRAVFRAKSYRELTTKYIAELDGFTGPREFIAIIALMQLRLGDAIGIASDSAFPSFESEIEMSSNPIGLLSTSLEGLRGRLAQIQASVSVASVGSVGVDLLTQFRLLDFYLNETKDLGEKFLAETGEMV